MSRRCLCPSLLLLLLLPPRIFPSAAACSVLLQHAWDRLAHTRGGSAAQRQSSSTTPLGHSTVRCDFDHSRACFWYVVPYYRWSRQQTRRFTSGPCYFRTIDHLRDLAASIPAMIVFCTTPLTKTASSNPQHVDGRIWQTPIEVFQLQAIIRFQAYTSSNSTYPG